MLLWLNMGTVGIGISLRKLGAEKHDPSGMVNP
jgi:hypothetical protein